MTTPAPNLDSAVLALWQRPGGPPTEREAAEILTRQLGYKVSQWAVREALMRLEDVEKITRVRPKGRRLAWRAVVTIRP